MALNFTTYVAQAANLMVIPSTDANFQTMLPGMIDYAEGRIYRELDALYTVVTDATTAVSSGNRNFVVPTSGSSFGQFITVDNFNIITPSSLSAATGSRVQLVPTSREFIDMTYPSGQATTGVPEFFAMVNNTNIILGPSPDLPYPAEIIGIKRPTSLSSANSSTYLTQYIPDVFMAASMIYAFGYMRDFGGQSDNPQATQSWENQYSRLFQSAQVEQLRAKFQSEGWTSISPSPLATPKRT